MFLVIPSFKKGKLEPMCLLSSLRKLLLFSSSLFSFPPIQRGVHLPRISLML